MELLGRLAVVVGISLALTLLLIVLYQDEGVQPSTLLRLAPSAVEGQTQPEPAMTQATTTAPASGTP
jgi:hypothetical protein